MVVMSKIRKLIALMLSIVLVCTCSLGAFAEGVVSTQEAIDAAYKAWEQADKLYREAQAALDNVETLVNEYKDELDLTEAQAKLAEAQAKLAEAQAAEVEAAKALEAAEAALGDVDETTDFKAQLDELAALKAAQQEIIANAPAAQQTVIDGLEASIAAAEKAIDAAEAPIAELNKLIEEAEATIEKLTGADTEKLNAEIAAVEAEIKDIKENQIPALADAEAAELAALDADLAVFEAAKDNADLAAKAFTDRVAALEAEQARLEDEDAAYAEDLAELDQRAADLEETKQQVLNAQTAAETKAEVLAGTVTALEEAQKVADNLYDLYVENKPALEAALEEAKKYQASFPSFLQGLYQYVVDAAQSALDSADDAYEEAMVKVGELEVQLAEEQIAADEAAKAYEEIVAETEDYVASESAWIESETTRLNELRAEIDADLTAAAEEEAAIEELLATNDPAQVQKAAEEAYNTKKTEIDAAKAAVTADYEKQEKALNERVTALEGRLETLNGQLENLKKQAESLGVDVSGMAEQVENLTAELNKVIAEQGLPELEKQLEAAEAEMELIKKGEGTVITAANKAIEEIEAEILATVGDEELAKAYIDAKSAHDLAVANVTAAQAEVTVWDGAVKGSEKLIQEYSDELLAAARSALELAKAAVDLAWSEYQYLLNGSTECNHVDYTIELFAQSFCPLATVGMCQHDDCCVALNTTTLAESIKACILAGDFETLLYEAERCYEQLQNLAALYEDLPQSAKDAVESIVKSLIEKVADEVALQYIAEEDWEAFKNVAENLLDPAKRDAYLEQVKNELLAEVGAAVENAIGSENYEAIKPAVKAAIAKIEEITSQYDLFNLTKEDVEAIVTEAANELIAQAQAEIEQKIADAIGAENFDAVVAVVNDVIEAINEIKAQISDPSAIEASVKEFLSGVAAQIEEKIVGEFKAELEEVIGAENYAEIANVINKAIERAEMIIADMPEATGLVEAIKACANQYMANLEELIGSELKAEIDAALEQFSTENIVATIKNALAYAEEIAAQLPDGSGIVEAVEAYVAEIMTMVEELINAELKDKIDGALQISDIKEVVNAIKEAIVLSEKVANEIPELAEVAETIKAYAVKAAEKLADLINNNLMGKIEAAIENSSIEEAIAAIQEAVELAKVVAEKLPEGDKVVALVKQYAKAAVAKLESLAETELATKIQAAINDFNFDTAMAAIKEAIEVAEMIEAKLPVDTDIVDIVKAVAAKVAPKLADMINADLLTKVEAAMADEDVAALVDAIKEAVRQCMNVISEIPEAEEIKAIVENYAAKFASKVADLINNDLKAKIDAAIANSSIDEAIAAILNAIEKVEALADIPGGMEILETVKAYAAKAADLLADLINGDLQAKVEAAIKNLSADDVIAAVEEAIELAKKVAAKLPDATGIVEAVEAYIAEVADLLTDVVLADLKAKVEAALETLSCEDIVAAYEKAIDFAKKLVEAVPCCSCLVDAIEEYITEVADVLEKHINEIIDEVIASGIVDDIKAKLPELIEMVKTLADKLPGFDTTVDMIKEKCAEVIAAMTGAAKEDVLAKIDEIMAFVNAENLTEKAKELKAAIEEKLNMHICEHSVAQVLSEIDALVAAFVDEVVADLKAKLDEVDCETIKNEIKLVYGAMAAVLNWLPEIDLSELDLTKEDLEALLDKAAAKAKEVATAIADPVKDKVKEIVATTRVEIPAVEATCVDNAWTSGWECICGKVIEAPVELENTATGEHTYVDGVCSVCGDVEKKRVPGDVNDDGVFNDQDLWIASLWNAGYWDGYFNTSNFDVNQDGNYYDGGDLWLMRLSNAGYAVELK